MTTSTETLKYTFTAKYRGSCPICTLDINRGDAVGSTKKGGKAMHVSCAVNGAIAQQTATAAGNAMATRPIVVSDNGGNPLLGLAEALTPLMSVKIDESKVEQMIAESWKSKQTIIESAMDRVASDIEAATTKISDNLGSIVEQKVREFGTLRIEVSDAKTGETRKIEARAHQKFDKLVRLAQMRKNVLMTGPSGSGKSYAAGMLAEVLGLTFGYVMLDPQCSRSVLFGFIDAHGKYHATAFRNAIEFGGVICIDEVDNASANLAIALQSGLASGDWAFPDGAVRQHEDCIIVGTSNTALRGGNPLHAARRAQDAAFLDRWLMIEWTYDNATETALTLALNPKAEAWVKWIQSVRTFVEEQKIGAVISPRASLQGADLMLRAGDVFTMDEIADTVLFKGIDADIKAKIVRAHPIPA